MRAGAQQQETMARYVRLQGGLVPRCLVLAGLQVRPNTNQFVRLTK